MRLLCCLLPGATGKAPAPASSPPAQAECQPKQSAAHAQPVNHVGVEQASAWVREAADEACCVLEEGLHSGLASWSDRLVSQLSLLGITLSTTNSRLAIFGRTPVGSAACVVSAPSTSRAPWDSVPPCTGWTRGALHDRLAKLQHLQDPCAVVVISRFYDVHAGPDASCLSTHYTGTGTGGTNTMSRAASPAPPTAATTAPASPPPPELHGQQSQQLLRMRPGDLIALPIVREGRVVGALLLGWGASPRLQQQQPKQQQQRQQAGGTVISVEAPTTAPAARSAAGAISSGTAVVLAAAELRALRRLASFLGAGVFCDPGHASYLEQVALLISGLSAGRHGGLHDVVAAVLDRLPGMLQTKFCFQLQPLLAAVHGPASPAVFFARRLGSGTPASALPTPVGRPQAAAASNSRGPSATNFGSAQQGVLGGSSHSAVGGCSPYARLSNCSSVQGLNSATGLDSHTGSRKPSALDVCSSGANLAMPPPLGGAGGLGSGAGAGGLASGDPALWDGGVGAGIMGLGGAGAPGVSRVKAVRTALTHTLLQRALRSSARSTGSGAGTDTLAATPSTEPPRPLTCLVVADASSQVLEEEQPGRDVLLAANLTGAWRQQQQRAQGAGGTVVAGASGALPSVSQQSGAGGVACLVLLVEQKAGGLGAQSCAYSSRARHHTPRGSKQQLQQGQGQATPKGPALASSGGGGAARSAGHHAVIAAALGSPGSQPLPRFGQNWSAFGVRGVADTATDLLGSAFSALSSGTGVGVGSSTPNAPTAPLPPPLLATVVSANAAAAAAAGAAAASLPLRPFRLALYLVSGEVLPSGVLEAVAAEMRGLMPLVFGAMHAALGAGGTATCDLVNLQAQLLQRAATTGGMGQGAALYPRTQSMDLPSPLPPALQLQPGAAQPHLLSPGYPGPAHAGQRAPARSVSSHPRSPRGHAANGGGGGGNASPPHLRRRSGAGGAFGTGAALGSSSRLRLASAAVVNGGAGSLGAGNGVGFSGGDSGQVLEEDEDSGMVVDGGDDDDEQDDDDGEDAEGLREIEGLMSSTNGDDMTMERVPGRFSASVRDRSAPYLPFALSSPVLQLEDVAGPRPLELLVSSARSRLSAVAAGSEAGEEARLAVVQDLSAVDLLEVVGSGGQGVVFRGSLHGLEAAIKVWEHAGRAPLEHDGEGLTGEVHANWDDAPNEDGGKAQPPEQGKEQGKEQGHQAADKEQDTEQDRDRDRQAASTKDCIRQAKRGAMEVAVTATLSHPNIVQTYAHFSDVVVVERQQLQASHGIAATAPTPSGAPQLRLCAFDDPVFRGRKAGPLNTVLCLEYCDAGTLLSAARRGDFRLPGSGPRDGPLWPALVPLLTSLLEVALALRYLHSRRLVHCDLKPGNVLLRSSPRDPRGWACKLSDFGCVRVMDEYGPDGACGFRMAQVFGTVAYLAPECFSKGRLLGAGLDIYAFGIVMWELMHCRTPYSGADPKELPRQVVRNHVRPEFHALAPVEYSTLAVQCMSGAPDRRPTATQLVSILQQMLAAAKAAAANTQQQQRKAQQHLQQQQSRPRPQHPMPRSPSANLPPTQAPSSTLAPTRAPAPTLPPGGGRGGAPPRTPSHSAGRLEADRVTVGQQPHPAAEVEATAAALVFTAAVAGGTGKVRAPVAAVLQVGSEAGEWQFSASSPSKQHQQNQQQHQQPHMQAQQQAPHGPARPHLAQLPGGQQPHALNLARQPAHGNGSPASVSSSNGAGFGEATLTSADALAQLRD